MISLYDIVIMTFGAVCAIVGIILSVADRSRGRSSIEVLGAKINFSGRHIIIFLTGAVIFVLPFWKHSTQHEPQQDTKTANVPVNKLSAANDSTRTHLPIDVYETGQNLVIHPSNDVRKSFLPRKKMWLNTNQYGHLLYRVYVMSPENRGAVVLNKDQRAYHVEVVGVEDCHGSSHQNIGNAPKFEISRNGQQITWYRNWDGKSCMELFRVDYEELQEVPVLDKPSDNSPQMQKTATR